MKEKVKKVLNNKYLKNVILVFLSIILCELIFFIVGDATFGLYNWIRIIISSIIVSLIISMILSFFKPIVSKFTIIAFDFILSFYAFLQLGFKSFLGVYISLNTKSQLSAVVDYIKDFLHSFKFTYYLIFIPFILLVVYLVFLDKKIFKEKIKKRGRKKKKVEKPNNFKPRVIMACSIIALSIMYYATISLSFMQNDLQMVSNIELIKNPSNPSIAINQFGVVSYGILDIKSMIIPSISSSSSVVAYTQVQKQETDYSREIDDEAWEELIDNEEDETYNNLNNYFISQDITDKNEYTGLFEGKNLIVIMMESVNDIFINEEYFPNFYKLYTEGWSWQNNYSPRNSCSTGNNEMSGMISLYSIYNTCTANKYKENTYYESIFNLFNNQGYNTSSMHDYTQAYYYRKTIHANMGSQIYYGVEDLDIDYSNLYRNWASDEDFMSQVLNILDEYDEDTNFMTWLTTVSSHQPYGVSSIQGDQYLSLFEETDYSTDLERYLSKLKILDNALGILLDGLEQRGILDDTVIVLYGDHYPYGLKTDVINEILDYDTSVDYEAERVPFVIYNSTQEAKTFDEYTSYINILPTLANLFNLDYDPRLYVGSDLLSDDYESLVVFADGSWRDENVLYNASNAEVTYYTNKTYSTDKIMQITNKVSLKLQMSQLAIETDYFTYLNEALNNEEITVEE